MAWRPKLFPWLLISTWEKNPGNKTTRCGVIAVAAFLTLLVIGDRCQISANAFVAGIFVVLILAFATLVFAEISVRNYFRRRKSATTRGA